MGALVENAKLIIDDLKSSWYFRLWCFFWLVCTLAVFSSLIILGKRTTYDTEHPELHMWLENASSITFPRFSIRVHGQNDENGQIITDRYCRHENIPLQIQQCPGMVGVPPPTNKCIMVPADSITAKNVWGEWYTGDTFIECVLNTTGSEPDGNRLLIWSDEAPGKHSFGGVDSGTAFIGPDADAWVVIEKEILETHEFGEIVIWNKKLDYHSSNFTQGHYRIAVVLGSFRVAHFFFQNAYNGWMGLADVGGFAFFSIILHTIVMMFVGICMDNDSRFLRGDGGHRPI